MDLQEELRAIEIALNAASNMQKALTAASEEAPDDFKSLYTFMSNRLLVLEGGLQMRKFGLNLTSALTPFLQKIVDFAKIFDAAEDGSGIVLREDMSDGDPLDNEDVLLRWQGRFSIS